MRALVVAVLVAAACGEEPRRNVDLCPFPPEFPSDGVVLRADADVDAIREATELSAIFACGTGALTAVELPNLERVTGAIELRMCAGVRVVSLPSLRAAGRIRLSDMVRLEEVELGALEELTDEGDLSSLHLELLPRLRMIELSRVRRLVSGLDLFGTALTRLELPLLIEARAIGLSDTHVEILSAPELVRTFLGLSENPLLREVALPNALVLDGLHISYAAGPLERIDLSRVERIGDVTLRVPDTNVEIELGGLRTIEGSLRVETSTGPELRWFSSLESVGAEVELSVGPFTDVRFDSLMSFGGSFALIIRGGDVYVPRLERIGGLLAPQGSIGRFSFPSLERAGGLELVWTQLSTASGGFAALRHVEGNVTLRSVDGLDADVLLPALAHVDGNLELEDNDTAAIRLPSLVDVGGKLALKANTATIASLPALTRVGDDLVVFENPRLVALDLPVLLSVGGDLILANNQRYPTCEAEEIAAQIAGEIGGGIATTGNDEAASCGD